MCHFKTTTDSVIVGALCMNKKWTDEYNNKIPGRISVYEIQKIELGKTTYFLSRILSMRLKNNTQKGQ